jgi:hypothetical protein
VVGSQTAVSISAYHLMPKNSLNNCLVCILAPTSDKKIGGLMLFF